jgi:ankyrin repeat protein
MLRFLVEERGVPVHAPLTADEEAYLAPVEEELAATDEAERLLVCCTPLAWAAAWGCDAAALYLLSRPGVDAAVVNSVFSVGPDEQSLLGWSVVTLSHRVVEALLERGADPLLPQPSGGPTPLLEACNVADVSMLRLVLSAAERRTGRTARALLEEREWDFGRRGPRFFCVAFGPEDKIAATLAFFGDELGVDLLRAYPVEWIKEGGGSELRTPLMAAASSRSVATVAWLIETAGADVNEVDEKIGWTALHVACQLRGKEEAAVLATVKYLVEQAGADMALRDKEGQTPADAARAMGYLQVAAYFEGKAREQRLAMIAAAEAVWQRAHEQQVAAAAAAEAALLEELAAEEAAAVDQAGRKTGKKQKKKQKKKGGQQRGDGGGGGAGEAAASGVESGAAAAAGGGGGGGEQEGPAAATAVAAAAVLDALSLEKKEEAGEAKAKAGGGSDDDEEEEEEEDEEAWLLEGAPDDCVCPISLTLLTDPRVAPDGFTCACLEGLEQRRGVDRN